MKFILVIKLFRNSCFKVNMKSLNKIILIFLVTILTINLSYSQEERKYSQELIETLSSYQKELIEKERKYLNKQRDAIRKTFSIEQKDMIADSTLTDSEKRNKIIASFSSGQKELIEKYRIRIDSIRKKFYNSLSGTQKSLIKKRRKRSKKND